MNPLLQILLYSPLPMHVVHLYSSVGTVVVAAAFGVYLTVFVVQVVTRNIRDPTQFHVFVHR